MRWLFLSVLILWSGSSSLHAREFSAEGSDLLIGVGATQIARAGAVVAADNGVYSLYWNPAGLADLKHPMSLTTRKITPAMDLSVGYRF